MKCLEETVAYAQHAEQFLLVWYQDTASHSDDARHAEKVSRSFERMRRAVVRALESLGTSIGATGTQAAQRRLMLTLLTKSVTVLERVIPRVCRPAPFVSSI